MIMVVEFWKSLVWSGGNWISEVNYSPILVNYRAGHCSHAYRIIMFICFRDWVCVCVFFYYIYYISKQTNKPAVDKQLV